MNQPTNRPPAPLEWHPAYRDRTWLLDWLEGRTELLDQDSVMVPFEEAPWRFKPYVPNAPIVPEKIRAHTLKKQRAQALAPYVGRPFIYRWNVAIDELGRMIAGEARIHYIDDHGYYWGWRDVPSRNGFAPVEP
ncbi:hypothetical protein ACIBCH_20660 [Amycolatopsis thailandensis]|uniref:hypothetical protein n=1 Tax=Amycolatopsis thailandensis TaxID=589330 RepID=UPI0037B3BA2B